MTASVHNLDALRTAKRYGPKVYARLVQKIVAEQKAGGTGRSALGEAFDAKRHDIGYELPIWWPTPPGGAA